MNSKSTTQRIGRAAGERRWIYGLMQLALALAAAAQIGCSQVGGSDAVDGDVASSRAMAVDQAMQFARSLQRAREACSDAGIPSPLTCANLEDVRQPQDRRATELAKAAYAIRDGFFKACEQHQTRGECRRLLRDAFASEANRSTK
jgi:hypothetical protein